MKHIPESALNQHIAVVGKTRSGKTNSAKLLIEQVAAAGVRTNAGYARRAVLRRDMGICSLCGCDCLWLRSALKQWMPHWPPYRWTEKTEQDRAVNEMRHRLRTLGSWQADHIRPVVEGGGECGLDNLRTLCHDCHAEQTRQLAARRAASRREQKASLFVRRDP